jgi:hypothetical protein
MRTEARFPGVDRGAGFYESFYIKAVRPGGGQAVWIRHTVYKRPDEEATSSLWLTLFDAEAEGPVAVKVTAPASELSAPPGAYIKVNSATLEPGRAQGSIEADGLSASWDLTFNDHAETFFHLPAKRLYSAPLPRTKFLSPHPAAVFDGELVVGGERLALEGWPGMIGHNWGAEHAERWIWVQASELDGRPDSYLDIAAGRIKIGPWTTPWVANGMLRLGGTEHRLGGFGKVIGTKIDSQPTNCSFELAGSDVKVRGRLGSEPKNFVAWIYADPKGPEHNTLNCSISDIELAVELDGGPPERLEVTGAAALETGMRDTDHGVPLQPFPDG